MDDQKDTNQINQAISQYNYVVERILINKMMTENTNRLTQKELESTSLLLWQLQETLKNCFLVGITNDDLVHCVFGQELLPEEIVVLNLENVRNYVTNEQILDISIDDSAKLNFGNLTIKIIEEFLAKKLNTNISKILKHLIHQMKENNCYFEINAGILFLVVNQEIMNEKFITKVTQTKFEIKPFDEVFISTAGFEEWLNV